MIRFAHSIDAIILECDAIPLSDGKHQLRLKRALDVHM